MDVIFDWNLGNMIYNGLITLRLCGFPFAEIGVVSVSTGVVTGIAPDTTGASWEAKFSDLGKIVLSEKKIKDRYTGSNFTVP